MALLSRSTTVVRFLAPVPARVDREAMARAIVRRGFQEPEGEGHEAQQWCGWVGVHDPLATDLEPTDLFFQQYLLVGFRLDRRVVPAKLLFLERRRAEAALRAERGIERLGRALREQVRAEVQSRLLTRALPTPRLYDCAWNLDTGHVYLTGGARAARDAFVELFRQTFTVAPVPLIPYLAAAQLGLPDRTVEAVRAVEPSSLIAEPVTPRGVPRLPLAEVSP